MPRGTVDLRGVDAWLSAFSLSGYGVEKLRRLAWG
jgi:hypothetical protein